MAQIFVYFSILLFVIDFSSGALNPDCKNHKNSLDSFVCVCTEAEPCDNIEAPVKTAHGVVTRWESSRDGARLRKQTLNFGKNESHGNTVGSELHVKVNRDVKYQEIFGFGGAFTDATGINIKKLSPKLQEQMLRDYFSKDGLEYNVGRIPIGGSDFSTHAYTYDDNAIDKTLSKFNLTKEDADFKIPLILKAKSMATHEVRLFGSPWSAPKWMKTNNDLAHGGSIKGEVGSEFWQIYAKYFVHYLNAYKAHNITHWGITIQNEPLGKWGFNSMYFTAEMMRDFLAKTLGPELERSGYGTDKLKVMIWDFNVDHALDYVKTIYADKTAAKYAAGTAVHWYEHKPQTWGEMHKMNPDKFLLATEACSGPGAKLGAWNLAEEYAQDVLLDLLNHVTGWVDWNMVLDMKGGPNWQNNFNSAPMITDPDHHQYYRQPSFYALAHFSKFLAPGSVRIDSTIVMQNNTQAIVGAFRTTQNSTVVVVVNNHDQTVHLTVDDTKAGKLSAIIEPRSIQTYVYYD